MNAPAPRTKAASLAPGFADPVRDARDVFRAVLDAMAEPGRVIPVDGITEAPAPLSPVAAAVVATLADFETTVWRDETLSTEAIAAWIAFHTGAPPTDDASAAAFAVIGDAAGAPGWETFAVGTDVDPSLSTTAILQVAGFDATLPGTRRFRLTGPGIETTRDVTIAGAPADLAARAAANRALFPRGVDLVLAGPQAVMALPRTTRIEEIG
jgi:alpha-D-ribose 1-methylphosphonate 5-triphosphate synthase subunit PhnH